MTVSAFISELIRDANQIDKLGDFQKRRMLERAVTIIREMREQTGIRGGDTNSDMVIDLQTTAAALTLGKRSNQQVSEAMLDAAEAIRVLKILFDGKETTQ